MRLLLLGPLPPHRGGIAQFGSRLSGELEKLGHSVFAAGFSKLYPGFLFPGKSQLEQGARAPDGILHGYDPFAWSRARKALSALDPDAVITQWWHPFFAPCLAFSTPKGARSAAVCHNVVPHESMPLAGPLSRFFLRRQDLLAVHSTPSAAEADRMGPRVLKLFHPLYDQYLSTGLPRERAREVLGIEPGETALLFFGLVREYKGFDLLLDACSLLPESCRVIAAGENYTGKSFTSPRLMWKNEFIPDREVGTWFNAADIVVLPYRSASQSGIAQIALSFRKPLVVTPVGGLPEVVEHGVTGTVAGDVTPEALARAVEECAGFAFEKGTAAAIEDKAREYSWQTYARKLAEALE